MSLKLARHEVQYLMFLEIYRKNLTSFKGVKSQVSHGSTGGKCYPRTSELCPGRGQSSKRMYLSYLAGTFLSGKWVLVFSCQLINSFCSDSRLTKQLSDNLAFHVPYLQREKVLDKLMQMPSGKLHFLLKNSKLIFCIYFVKRNYWGKQGVTI